MNRRIFMLSLMVISFASMHASPGFRTYRLPEREKICDCMNKLGLDNFDEKTHYSEKNAGRSLYALGLRNDWMTRLYDYAKYLGQDHNFQMVAMMNVMTQSQEAEVYKCMLGEEADVAIKELHEAGVDLNDDEENRKLAIAITRMALSKE